ncbi:MAG: preprotein translocase subunit SecA [Clostridia bacterium]|nr:preprotein translocase subunit SecA [Clostridia bacterium]
MGFLEKIFGNYSQKELKRLTPLLEKTLSYEEAYSKFSDAELKAKTTEFKNRFNNGETLDDLLPEAYATVREAAWRVLGMKHFPVQIIGGIVLHQGRIAEMKTGEGKTLVATLPAYLNALSGKGVHIVTVNDYLAKRDSEWMGKVYNFLGISVGLVVHDLDANQRKTAYNADITYGTNNELGFDYLRDNMVVQGENRVQRGHNFAIVDEVDSILIDEARTPLIISGMGDKSTKLYELADAFVAKLSFKRIKEEDKKTFDNDENVDYIVDEKARSVNLTPRGIGKAEHVFGIENLSDPENMEISHHINQAMRAHGIMQRDKDYVVNDDGEVVIVDEFTGRMMPGRRYSDGLHQAIEAKEKVAVQRESKTLATITFQNYFRMYKKLSGMTGTAMTEEEEFRGIYKLDVIEVPTNKPLARQDLDDQIYKSEQGKLLAVVKQIKECYEKGQPILVGTVTIEKSELLSALLKKNGIPHNVLNAKHHEKEAEIVAQAGKKGMVTIATNMAGRGTDIMLGGNAEFLAKKEMKKLGYSDEMIVEATGYGETDNEEILSARAKYAELHEKFKAEIAPQHDEVVALGGLYILGTERHESRRIDNQLRGRAGRQGDPGASRFFIAMEDDIMRLFGSEKYMGLVDSLGMDDSQPLEMKMLSNAIESAQKRVEGRNFDSRKHVLQYDDVMNTQRELIYGQRNQVLDGDDVQHNITNMMHAFAEDAVARFTAEGEYPDDWNLNGLIEYLQSVFLEEGELSFTNDDLETMTRESLTETVDALVMDAYKAKEEEFGAEHMRNFERYILLKVVDTKWMDHIDEMDQLKQGIWLRSYGQKDPVMEYKNLGSDMFDDMVEAIKIDTARFILNAKIKTEIKQEERKIQMSESRNENSVEKRPVKKQPVHVEKVGRNDPCPCGSGLKYKKCCGK